MLLLATSLALAPLVQNFHPLKPITKEVETVKLTITGDFDQDGEADLALLASVGTKGLIRTGDGSGNFAVGYPIDFGLSGIETVAVGDLDGDGFPDLAAFANDESIAKGSFLFGTGDGAFGAPIFMPAGPTGHVSRRAKIVDLDGDGDMDIVVAGSVLLVIQNLGGRNLAPAQPISDSLLGQNSGVDFVVFDVEGDGDLDLVYAGVNGLTVVEQIAPLQFQDRPSLPSFNYSERIEAEDLDGDGDLDLVIGDRFLDTLQFVENLGTGQFVLRGLPSPVASWKDIELMDVNRDGRVDVVVALTGPESAVWLENQGGFSFALASLPNASEPGATFLAKAEVNGDGIDDLVFTRSEGTVDVLISDPSLGAVPFGASSMPLHRVLPRFEDAIATDLDGDGDADIVASTTTEGLYVLENIGFSSYTEAEPRVSGATNGFLGTTKLRAVDLDGDGDQDLVCVNGPGQVFWIDNDGTGALTPRTLVAGAQATGEAYVADVDLDGDLDVLVATVSDQTLRIEQTSPGVFNGPVPVLTVQSDLVSIRLVDLDRDAAVDLLLVTRAPNGPILRPSSLRWSRGNGDGTFAAPVFMFDGLEDADQLEVLSLEVPAATIPSDVIWNSKSAPRMDGAISGSTLAYAPLMGLAQLTKRAERYAFGDIDMVQSNGSYDLVVQEGSGGPANPARLIVYRQTGISFAQPETVAENLQELKSLSVVDLNANGAMDILVCSQGTPRLSMILNRREDPASSTYCNAATPNQTGQSGRMSAYYGNLPFNQDFILQANGLPADSTTLFLTSLNQGFQPMVPGSIGTLCLGGSIGRFVGPGQVQTSTADGAARLNVLRTMMPQPGGLMYAAAGSLWFFQAWYRDSQAGALTSNFTDALVLRFD